jgi:hypothetical protein
MAAPTNVTGVRAFLGLAGYYQCFVRNFAEKTAPIAKLLRHDSKFIWDKQCNTVFNDIKELLTTAPVLTYPNFDKAFSLDPDVCDGSIGAVLSQYDNHGVEHPVAFTVAFYLLAKPGITLLKKNALLWLKG